MTTETIDPLKQHDITANILKATLGVPFLCSLCRRSHKPGSAALTECLERLTVTVAGTLTRDWTIDLKPYLQRYAWHRHQTRMDGVDTKRYSHLIDGLGKFSLLEQLPLASPAELADPDGDAAYRRRYDSWLTRWHDRIEKAKETAAPLAGELKQLLPLPFAVGSPAGRETDSTNFIPDAKCEQELQRIERLLGPQTERTERTKNYPTIQITHRFRRGRGVTTNEVARRVCNVFSAPPSAFIPWHARAGGFFPPEALGLDPAFWRSITLAHTQLSLHTAKFTLHP